MRQEKKYIVEELVNEIRGTNPLVFTDYSKVKANDLAHLRAQLKTIHSKYRVVQNSLFQRALDNIGLGRFGNQFTGPLAVTYGGRDVIEVIKTLIKFTKDYPDAFVVKGGIVDSQFLELKGLEELAKLPPKEVLLARLVGQINAPLNRFVMVLRGNLQRFICVLDGINRVKNSEN